MVLILREALAAKEYALRDGFLKPGRRERVPPRKAVLVASRVIGSMVAQSTVVAPRLPFSQARQDPIVRLLE